MKRWPMRIPAVLGAALLVSLLAVSAFAQFQTGNIYGKAEAKDGSLLPGVTVTLTGVGAPQTFVTDTNGNFRFLNLSPGRYALKGELAGFGTAVRQGVTVSIGHNAEVTLTLAPAASESITVTAEAPLLDMRKAGTGAVITKVEMENVPTGRDPWVILQETPSVLIDRVNVGGNESGQQSGYIGKGTIDQQSTWNVDGVNITDVGALGSSPTYYDFDSFEEMQVTTGGVDPRIMTPGVQLNMVTKRGTNEFKGSGRWFKTTNSLQADPKIPGEATSYLKYVNEIDKIDDYGVEIGGPIIQDKLWIWGAYARNQIDLLTATLLNSGARFLDKTKLDDQNIKLNAQLTSTNSLTISDMFGNKVKLGRNVSTARPPETAWNQSNSYNGKEGSLTDPTMWKIEDTQIFGPSFYVTGLYSKVQGGFQLIGDQGKGCKTLDCASASDILPPTLDPDGTWHRSYLSYLTERPQKQYRIDSSAFFSTGAVNHELKFGFGYRDASVRSVTVWPGRQYTVQTGEDLGFVQLWRDLDFTYGMKATDAYVGDTVIFGKFTLQAGFRYDQQKGDVSAGSIAANPTAPDLLPAISWNAITGLKWTDISPRLGVTYSMGTNRRTLVRAAYSRYVDQMGGGIVSSPSPGGYQYLYMYYNDLNHDNIAQSNEIDRDYGPLVWVGVDPANPGVPQQFYRWGDVNAPKTDELIVGFDHEVLTDFSVGMNFTYRKLTDFTWWRPEKHQGQNDFYTRDDYVAAATPITATLPNGQSVSLPYYHLKAGLDPWMYYVAQNRPDYSQKYQGVELSATKRMSNRWMLRSNITFQDWTQSIGTNAVIDPTRQRDAWGCSTCDGSAVLYHPTGSAKTNIYLNSKWAYNFNGVYQIPVVETAFGFSLTGRQGYALPWAYRTVSDGAYKLLLAENEPDQYRLRNIIELDLRLAKELKVSRAGMVLSVDAFNVLNRNTVLQREVRRLNLGASGRVTEVQSPRAIRFGARVTF